MQPTLYACPVCQAPLNSFQKQLNCANGHSFDIHKKGYVNLLLAHRKRSKAPGDDAQMVASRRRFLRQGHYQPLATRIAELCQAHLPQQAMIWDAGCGEGYYTNQIAGHCPGASLYGLDISKPAITAASQDKSINWCVASSTHPPYQDAAFDGIVSVFSRVDSEPFHRVLKPGGQVLMAAPDFDHLHALRSVIYDDVRPYDTSKHRSYLDARFSLVSEERLEVPLLLPDAQAIRDLLGMTPHAHRLSPAVQSRIETLEQLQDKACFRLYRFVHE